MLKNEEITFEFGLFIPKNITDICFYSRDPHNIFIENSPIHIRIENINLHHIPDGLIYDKGSDQM